MRRMIQGVANRFRPTPHIFRHKAMKPRNHETNSRVTTSLKNLKNDEKGSRDGDWVGAATKLSKSGQGNPKAPTALHKHTVFLPNANEKPVVVDDEPRRNAFSESNNDESIWARVPQHHPVRSMIPIPSPVPSSIPKIQHKFGEESSEARRVRTGRLDAVKGNFTHAWRGYKTRAWMSDEVKPISGEAHNPFGGWAATLVDALGFGAYSGVILSVKLTDNAIRHSLDYWSS
ncbi:hypothetical protein CISG_04027 [Coccidioides immitis RMSCC 3703]|uniref:Uncharacterized protein n=1 Tax=Coccidioides immitis RMSCC 3703 TaxID=454286 RepID=A0A0J8QS89_COCIT|nr:hypothetical protein CISG_04027 [Coccidioides immitis RMSCC 3703]